MRPRPSRWWCRRFGEGTVTAKEEARDRTASELIDATIASLGNWRGATLARMRALIDEAEPLVVEEVTWRGVPVCSHGGSDCTGKTARRA